MDIIGDSVLVFVCAKPFNENEYWVHHTFVKLMSSEEAMKYALDYISKDDHLPVRVDIFRNVDGVKFSEALEDELINYVKRSKLELEAEVHLREDAHRGGHERLVYGLLGELGLFGMYLPEKYGGQGLDKRHPPDALAAWGLL